jgi:hypothetical protein
MGALRAAELWRFGMRGVGEVFRLYRDGVVTGDDEVAIVHGPAEEGHRALSEPLVNIRMALRTAADLGVLTTADAAVLLELARGVPFRARSYRALASVARGHLPAPVVDNFLAWAGKHAVDSKAADARLLLELAAAADPSLRPHGPGDLPIVNLWTHHLESWHARHAAAGLASRADVVAAIMLTHDDFPAEHRRQVLADLVAAGDSTVDDDAVRMARERGLVADGTGAGTWLLPGEADLPADERMRRLLTRAFGARDYRRSSPSRLPERLDTGPVLAAAGEVVATAASLNALLPAADPNEPDRRLRFRAAVVERTFIDLWGCDEAGFRAAMWDRGFAHRDAFLAAAEPLVTYLKIAGRPELPRLPAHAR